MGILGYKDTATEKRANCKSIGIFASRKAQDEERAN